MNIFFAMSLSGSIIFLLYLSMKPFSYFLNANWQYKLLKLSMFFYLSPYQIFRNTYLAIFNRFFGDGKYSNPFFSDTVFYDTGKIIYILEDGSVHFRYKEIVVGLVLLWYLIIFYLVIDQVNKYFRCKKHILMISEQPTTEINNFFKNILVEQAPTLKGKIRLLINENISSPHTIGILNPIIVIPRPNKNFYVLKMYLLHEIYHVKKRDVLYKFIYFIIILLHWYNPLVYLLFFELCKISELACDENVIACLGENHIHNYGTLIVESSKKDSNISILFADTFSRKSGLTKGRIIYMSRNHKQFKHVKAVTLLIAIIICILTPISVIAYQPSINILVDNQNSIDSNTNTMIFLPEQDKPLVFDDTTANLDFTATDEYFIDLEGNIHEVKSHSQNPQLFCKHSYISGTIQKHGLNGKGCTISIYNAQMCQICGDLIQGTLVNKITYAVCIH